VLKCIWGECNSSHTYCHIDDVADLLSCEETALRNVLGLALRSLTVDAIVAAGRRLRQAYSWCETVIFGGIRSRAMPANQIRIHFALKGCGMIERELIPCLFTALEGQPTQMS
jgi:hypothetical protein